MSQFKQQFKQALQGDSSFESSEVVDYAPEPVTPSSEMTEDDMDDVLDERYAVDLNRQFLPEVDGDCRQLQSAVILIDAVGKAATAAETMPPAVAESFVSQANCIIDDASKVLGTEIPKLENDDDGSVSDVSLESLNDWFDTAKQAFRSSVSQFMERLGLALVRLNDSSKGLLNRCSRVRVKLEGRKGSGGKELNILSRHLELMIQDEGYAVDPMAELQAFAKVSAAVAAIIEQYHVRCDELMKMKVFDAVVSTESNGSIFSGMDISDLRTQMQELIANQTRPLLGNTIYAFSSKCGDHPLGVELCEITPYAKSLVRKLPPAKSLNNEGVLEWVGVLEQLIAEQTVALERITDRCNESFDAVKQAWEKVGYVSFSSDDEEVYSGDPIVILRLETQVINEIGSICKRLASYQSDLIDRIDAALIIVEESLFQD